MAVTELKTGSLILYKGRPGRITQMGTKKLAIRLADGDTLSVRPKDVLLLHPGPLDSFAGLAHTGGEVQVAWELLAGQKTTLADLAELAYGDFTPATAWAAWQLLEDGLLFSGTPEAVLAHTVETVTAEREARAAKAAEEAAWAAFLDRVNQSQFDPTVDNSYLEEVVELALGQRDNSRVMAALGRSETPEAAHALLLALGYWDTSVDPYPVRAQLPTTPPLLAIPPLPVEARRDLTYLTALAIDDAGSRDPDDALSYVDGRLWVHIADVAALVFPDSSADREARARAANLYLPEGTVHMLPPDATQRLALGLADVSPALSFGMTFNAKWEVVELEIVPSWVRVQRLSYDEADSRLDETPLRELHALSEQLLARRKAQAAVEIDLPEVKVRLHEGQVIVRPLPALRSRNLVREAMLVTGEAVARYAQENNIPVAFSTQDPPDTDITQFDETPAGQFAIRRQMRRSQQRSTPAPHAGLGLAAYTQCTSPLRRYADLLAHQQLRAHLAGTPPLKEQEVMARIGEADAVTGSVRWAERRAIEHWTLVYLLQNPQWKGAGIVVERRGARSVVLIPDLALEVELYLRADYPLNHRLTLQVTEVNLPLLEAHFVERR